MNCYHCGRLIEKNEEHSNMLVKRDWGGYFPEWFHYPICADDYIKKVRTK